MKDQIILSFLVSSTLFWCIGFGVFAAQNPRVVEYTNSISADG